ncbi:MAG: hypothetical protein JO038_04830 [Alphaproteobacteria bacterium]|nr:hypothetical protein [Alphaproteobacteria bacterium]
MSPENALLPVPTPGLEPGSAARGDCVISGSGLSAALDMKCDGDWQGGSDM